MAIRLSESINIYEHFLKDSEKKAQEHPKKQMQTASRYAITAILLTWFLVMPIFARLRCRKCRVCNCCKKKTN